MAKHIVIERPNGTVTLVRSELESLTENPLSEHELIINDLYKQLNLALVVGQSKQCKHEKHIDNMNLCDDFLNAYDKYDMTKAFNIVSKIKDNCISSIIKATE